MRMRVITAVIGIVAILLLVWAGNWLFTAACLTMGLLAYREYYQMIKNAGITLYDTYSYLAVFCIIISANFHSVPLFYAITSGCFIALFLVTLRAGYEDMQSLFYTVIGSLYIGIGVGSLVLLRGVSGLIPQNLVSIHSGIFLILFAFISTWASDSFAYLVGSRWGRTSLAPQISPNKTVEGLIGGVIGTILLGVVFSWGVGYSLIHSVILSSLLSVMAPIGDLFESYMKRVCGVKDSGHLLPGHGGVLDRFDSLFFVAPTMVTFLIIVSHI